ncbi:hypothetical protein RKD18_007012 [Streptomyces phaeoluteigriseus]
MPKPITFLPPLSAALLPARVQQQPGVPRRPEPSRP